MDNPIKIPAANKKAYVCIFIFGIVCGVLLGKAVSHQQELESQKIESNNFREFNLFSALVYVSRTDGAPSSTKISTIIQIFKDMHFTGTQMADLNIALKKLINRPLDIDTIIQNYKSTANAQQIKILIDDVTRVMSADGHLSDASRKTLGHILLSI